MVLATAPCWVQPSSSKKKQQKYFSRRGTFNGDFNQKDFVNTVKKHRSHLKNFVKHRVSLLMNEVTMNLKNTTNALFFQGEKPKNQHPHFLGTNMKNFQKSIPLPKTTRFLNLARFMKAKKTPPFFSVRCLWRSCSISPVRPFWSPPKFCTVCLITRIFSKAISGKMLT